MLRTLILAVMLITGAGCSEKPAGDGESVPPGNDSAQPPEAAPAINGADSNRAPPSALRTFMAAGDDALHQFHQHCQQLHGAIQRFLEDSSEANWQALQPLWRQAHNHWHGSAFFVAAIDQRPLALAHINRLLAGIHSAPIMPGYLDSIDGYPYSGLVNDTTVPMTAQAIREQHQRFDRSEITLGLHALEFFLWSRPLTDFQISTAGTADNLRQTRQRRRAMLSLLGELLVTDSGQLAQLWSSVGDYWLVQPPRQFDRLLLTSALQLLLQLSKHSDLEANTYHWQLHTTEQLQQRITQFIAPQFEPQTATTLDALFERARAALLSLQHASETADTDAKATMADIEQWKKELRTARGLLIEQLQALTTTFH